MLVTRRSPLTGLDTTLDLPVTQAQLNMFYGPRERRGYVQDIFPDLSEAEREFIMTGYTEADWKKLFPDEEEAA